MVPRVAVPPGDSGPGSGGHLVAARHRRFSLPTRVQVLFGRNCIFATGKYFTGRILLHLKISGLGRFAPNSRAIRFAS